ncbi:Nif11-like leader peptide family natural product precursor [Brucepastera parasyntrophica]|nr:Nif11-like leader peptide family natural product precursor [Brucepastera parasyntrophica]ULQ58848.1 Nif11-like leader peptide family natural product precursor [Brucepastera parasyntrophica]
MGFTEFKTRMSTDDAFAAKFDEIGTIEEYVALAKKEGYTITVEEVQKNT